MEETKIIEVSITSLKITSEDEWLDTYIKTSGDKVSDSPQYLALLGERSPLRDWMGFRGLDWLEGLRDILDVYVSLKKEGQKEPILIYSDGRINTGHKRAASALYLNWEKLKAVVVPDNYKL